LSRQPTLTKMSEDPVYRAFALPALQAAKLAQQVAESQAQAAQAAQRMAEAEAQTEREARQIAEATAQTEREARQLAESKLQQLEAKLARLRQPE